MKKHRQVILLISLIIILSVSLSQGTVNPKADLFVTKPINKQTIHFLPVTSDWRNYYVLQSINDETNIIIGDFLRSEINLTLIMDKGSDGTVDKVIEYFPKSDKIEEPLKPSSKLFTEFTQMKKDIIEGSIFKNNFTYKMNSLSDLKKHIQLGRNIYKYEFGYTVKIYDPDKPTSIMSEFSFQKNLDGRCDLVFTTYYYYSFKTVISPEVIYSVYCKNSKDPYVLEVIESLYKLIGKR